LPGQLVNPGLTGFGRRFENRQALVDILQRSSIGYLSTEGYSDTGVDVRRQLNRRQVVVLRSDYPGALELVELVGTHHVIVDTRKRSVSLNIRTSGFADDGQPFVMLFNGGLLVT